MEVRWNSTDDRGPRRRIWRCLRRASVGVDRDAPETELARTSTGTYPGVPHRRDCAFSALSRLHGDGPKTLPHLRQARAHPASQHLNQGLAHPTRIRTGTGLTAAENSNLHLRFKGSSG